MTSFSRTALAIASLGALLLAGCGGPSASGLVPQSSGSLTTQNVQLSTAATESVMLSGAATESKRSSHAQSVMLSTGATE